MRYSLLFLVVILSCTRFKHPTVDKLLIIGIGNTLTYDSLGSAQLSLRTYIEINKGNELKYALGDYKYRYEKNPPYSLDKFYLLSNVDSINQLIDQVLINKEFGDLFISKGEEYSIL